MQTAKALFYSFRVSHTHRFSRRNQSIIHLEITFNRFDNKNRPMNTRCLHYCLLLAAKYSSAAQTTKEVVQCNSMNIRILHEIKSTMLWPRVGLQTAAASRMFQWLFTPASRARDAPIKNVQLINRPKIWLCNGLFSSGWLPKPIRKSIVLMKGFDWAPNSWVVHRSTRLPIRPSLFSRSSGPVDPVSTQSSVVQKGDHHHCNRRRSFVVGLPFRATWRLSSCLQQKTPNALAYKTFQNVSITPWGPGMCTHHVRMLTQRVRFNRKTI